MLSLYITGSPVVLVHSKYVLLNAKRFCLTILIHEKMFLSHTFQIENVSGLTTGHFNVYLYHFCALYRKWFFSSIFDKYVDTRDQENKSMSTNVTTIKVFTEPRNLFIYAQLPLFNIPPLWNKHIVPDSSTASLTYPDAYQPPVKYKSRNKDTV